MFLRGFTSARRIKQAAPVSLGFAGSRAWLHASWPFGRR
jgi:hypothetical protein